MTLAEAASLLLVIAAGGFLLLQGVLALMRPQVVRRFLGGFAASAVVHGVEVALRVLVGLGFIGYAGRSALPCAFAGFGWLLVLTSLPLLLVPWRWHQRFARWAVPLATRRMALYAVGCLAAAAAVFAGVLAGGTSASACAEHRASSACPSCIRTAEAEACGRGLGDAAASWLPWPAAAP